MPEVAVHEDRHTAAWEHKVWCAPACELAVKAEPGACRMEGTAEQQLRLGVPAAATAELAGGLGYDPLVRHGRIIPRLAGVANLLSAGRCTIRRRRVPEEAA